MSLTVTKEVDVEVELSDVLEETSTKELIDIIEELLVSEDRKYELTDIVFGEMRSSPEGTRFLIECLCAPRGGAYISKAEAKRIICELIDEVFFET